MGENSPVFATGGVFVIFVNHTVDVFVHVVGIQNLPSLEYDMLDGSTVGSFENQRIDQGLHGNPLS